MISVMGRIKEGAAEDNTDGDGRRHEKVGDTSGMVAGNWRAGCRSLYKSGECVVSSGCRSSGCRCI